MESYHSFTDCMLRITPSVLGYKLKPFTLGHSIILKGVKSKFLTGEYKGLADINHVIALIVTDDSVINELALAVLICSTSHDEFMDEVNTDKFKDELKELAVSVRDNKIDLAKEVHLFAHYLKRGTIAPQYQVKNKNEGDIENNVLEFEQAVISTLMTECGYTRNECLNLPLSETLSAYLLYAHKMGSIEILGKDVYELINKGKE